jgi:TPR repeat protein
MIRSLSLICAAGIALAGCAGVVTESANIAKDKIMVERNIDRARAGDAEAQFKVGSSLCCSLMEDRASFYDTDQSVTWLCMAARQAHAPAMLKLGKIFSGDTVDGVRVMRRVTSAAVGSSQNLPAAYAWTRMSADRGNRDAASLADSVWTSMTPADKQLASAMYRDGLSAECSPDLLTSKGV